MKASKAIEILQQIWFCMHLDHRNEEEDAIKLSIEALRRHQVRASLTYMDMMRELPEETPEEK